MNIAVNLAVLTFNEGMTGLQPLLHSIGGDISSRTIAFLRDQDAIRIQRAQEKEEDATKRRRKVQGTQKMLHKKGLQSKEFLTLLVGSKLCHHYSQNVSYAPKKYSVYCILHVTLTFYIPFFMFCAMSVAFFHLCTVYAHSDPICT